ncbi:unnamed protein product [Fraxinus pennsylvanica]|uniref:WRKY domain-containing protein n=1 Tax=Fraxinus pennsylvanica TaxID=56036 RepID=A0AAD1ZEX9_9LAMI|nr:unnamed protein product [Fraxinus pennsylvanica]
MEETKLLMLYGCKLAKNIEENLPNLANRPGILLKSCDGIIGVFSNLKELLSRGQMISGQSQELQQTDNIGAGIQEWLKTGGKSYHQATDLHNPQAVLGNPRTRGFSEGCANLKGVLGQQESGLELMISGMNVKSFAGGIGGEIIQPVDVDASGSIRASSSQCKRRRKDDGHKIRVIRVAAPQMGNLDLPPEDGYTWKKYGQKEILESRYPRSYYCCTHRKFYNCPAKKQVQRLNHDHSMFEVTYRGGHTCHISSTPRPPVEQGMIRPIATMQPPLPCSTSSSVLTTHWLSMDIKPSVLESTATIFNKQMFQELGGEGTGSSTAGTLASGRFPDNQALPVADMANTMFNGGSSSSIGIENIFSSMGDKWN